MAAQGKGRSLAGRFKAAGLRLDAGEGGDGEVDHFMTAFVQLFSCRLACARLVEREKEHAALGAEALFVAGRVPAKGKAFWREHDEFSAGLGDRVAASLFERAHEGGEPCAAGADSRGGFERGVPSVAALGGGAVSLEGRYDGQAQYFGVAVGEPLAAEKLDRLDALKEAGVGLARPGAGGVFANVAAKGGELAVALDDPVMPGGFEDVARLRATLRRRAVCKTLSRRVVLVGGLADSLPIRGSEGFRELAYQHAKGYAVWRGLYLHHQMKVVGHDGEGRDFVEASPFEMKGFYDLDEGSRKIVFDEAIRPDSGKRLQPLKPLKGHHIEVWRFVIETFEANHGDILPNYSERSAA